MGGDPARPAMIRAALIALVIVTALYFHLTDE
jgi:hypothetical protein